LLAHWAGSVTLGGWLVDANDDFAILLVAA